MNFSSRRPSFNVIVNAATRVLIERGADPSIATKIVDIATRNAARGGRGRGTPPAAPASQPAAAVTEAPAQGQAATAQVQGRGGATPAQANNNDESRPPRIDTMGGLTALLLAAREGHTEAVRTLIESGANINEVSPGDKASPLLIATINGHYDLAKLLLDRGADPKLASTAGPRRSTRRSM